MVRTVARRAACLDDDDRNGHYDGRAPSPPGVSGDARACDHVKSVAVSDMARKGGRIGAVHALRV